MLDKPYRLHADNYFEPPCVIKVQYKDCYVIVKCKNQAVAAKTIENGLNAYIRGGKNNEGSIYYFLNEYVKNNPGGDFKITTISSPADTAYKLLQIEQLEIENGRLSTKMLNNQSEAYIPMYNEETKAYGWIPPIAVMNFHKWLKTRKKAARKIKKSAQ